MALPPPSEFVILAKQRLEGPPPHGFDCQREAQNAFLYEWAWSDQRQRLTTTYVYHAAGELVAYTTVCMDAVVLGTREKPAALRYKNLAALKLAQLGVDHTRSGRGLGTLIIYDVVNFALEMSQRVGCRYVTLDAQPDLVEWYQRLGFKINRVIQKQRIEAAGTRDPAEIPVSMRFDLREV
jgi:GNAT superfamily N-acetyltransferase